MKYENIILKKYENSQKMYGKIRKSKKFIKDIKNKKIENMKNIFKNYEKITNYL